MRETRIPFMQSLIGKVLDGSKTVTRRPIRQMLCEGEGGPGRARLLRCENGIATFGDSIPDDPWPAEVKCPYGWEGDILLPTEVWAVAPRYDDVAPRDLSRHCRVWYRQQHTNELVGRCSGRITEVRIAGSRYRLSQPGRWRPPMFMPKWASRGRLEILSVRAERVQDITEEDAKAEGVERDPSVRVSAGSRLARLGPYKSGFARSWNAAYPKMPWAISPWVWRLEFRRVEK